MKRVLDKEQTLKLLSLGFQEYQASNRTTIYNCSTRRDEIVIRFDLMDLFELLPKEYKNGYLYTEQHNNKSYAGYRLPNNYKLIEKSSYELIDAMYKLVKWTTRKKKYDLTHSREDNSKYFGNICYKNCE